MTYDNTVENHIDENNHDVECEVESGGDDGIVWDGPPLADPENYIIVWEEAPGYEKSDFMIWGVKRTPHGDLMWVR